MTTFNAFRTLLVLSCLLTLAACGGGGGGGGGRNQPLAAQTLSGTAAAGAPIIGSVFVKDSIGAVRTTVLAADGSYTINVSGMTPPFLVRAEGTAGGRSYTVHSAATSADISGNINITPLTDLIVANVARQVAANYFDSGAFAGLTAAELNAAEDTLQQRLQAVLTDLGVAASIDLLRSAFSANHTGLDAALDVLRVTVDAATNTALITNVINNANITDDLTTTDSSILDSTGTVSGMTDWDAIRARLVSFEAAFATGLPAADDPLLLAQFDQAGFLDDGDNLATFLGGLTSDPGMVGFRLASLSLASLTPANAAQNGRAVVHFGVGDAAYGYDYDDVVMTGIYNTTTGGTNWVIAGNQRISDTGAEMRSILGFDYYNRTRIQSGIDFDTDADPACVIDYAVVTGPGLPTSGGGADGASAGLLLVRMNPCLGVFVASSPYAGSGTPLHPRTAAGHEDMYTWTDGEIAALPSDNLTYTQRYYDDNGTPGNLADDVLLATYSFTLLKPPLPAGSLSAASFPVITGPAVSTVLGVYSTGGPLAVTWNLPAGLGAGEFVAERWYTTGSDAEETGVPPAATGVTVEITPPTGTVTGGALTVDANDVYRRSFSYRLWVP